MTASRILLKNNSFILNNNSNFIAFVVCSLDQLCCSLLT